MNAGFMPSSCLLIDRYAYRLGDFHGVIPCPTEMFAILSCSRTVIMPVRLVTAAAVILAFSEPMITTSRDIAEVEEMMLLATPASRENMALRSR